MTRNNYRGGLQRMNLDKYIKNIQEDIQQRTDYHNALVAQINDWQRKVSDNQVELFRLDGRLLMLKELALDMNTENNIAGGLHHEVIQDTDGNILAQSKAVNES